VLADFGGAHSMQNGVTKPEYGAPCYRCKDDDIHYDSLTDAYRLENTREENVAIAQEAKTVLLRRDIYAMSFVLEELFQEDTAAPYAAQINALIQIMQDRSWKNRPSAKEALRLFESIFI
jgi:hypothetical protein